MYVSRDEGINLIVVIIQIRISQTNNLFIMTSTVFLHTSVDIFSFLTGGIGSLGIALRTRQISFAPIWTILHNDDNQDREASMNLKKLISLAKEIFFIKTRAIEHFFVGGCLYCAVRQVLLEHEWRSGFVHSIVCGTLVGAYQADLKRSCRSRMRQIRAVVGLGLLQETILTILMKIHLIPVRPAKCLSLNYDGIVYVIGAVGACVVGLFTNSFTQDIPQLELNEDDAEEDTDNFIFFKYILGRLWNIAITEVFIEVRRERRFFLGGSLAWTAEHFCHRVGIKSRAAVFTIAGAVVGAYFGTYGDEANQLTISSFGVASAGLFYGTFVDSQILLPGNPTEMSGLCFILFPLLYSILG